MTMLRNNGVNND